LRSLRYSRLVVNAFESRIGLPCEELVLFAAVRRDGLSAGPHYLLR
jgi:hypothetical protein